MKRILIASGLLLALTACSVSPYDSDGAISSPIEPPDHSHTVVQGDNTVEHDFVGYCGNTVTTVRYNAMGNEGESWERSFWGGTSVGLSDFLRWLNFEDGICRCLPEYYVKTEFSASEYGINLSEGYVRHEETQCQLTGEQVQWLETMMEEIGSDNMDDLCSLPTAEKRPVFK